MANPILLPYSRKFQIRNNKYMQVSLEADVTQGGSASVRFFKCKFLSSRFISQGLTRTWG